MKSVLEKIKTVFAILGLVVIGLVTGAFVGSSLQKRNSANEKKDAENAKENKKNEIEQTNASDLVSESDNADELCRERGKIKSDFRERVRNRLQENLQRLGSSGTDNDNS